MGEVGQLSPLKESLRFLQHLLCPIFPQLFLVSKVDFSDLFLFWDTFASLLLYFFLCYNTTDSCKHFLTIPVDVYFLSRAYMTPHSAPDCLYIV